MPSASNSPGNLAQSIQGGERSKSSGWEGNMVVALGGFQELKVKLQINLSKYVFFPGIFMETYAKRRPMPSCIPSLLLSEVIYGLVTQVGFFPLLFLSRLVSSCLISSSFSFLLLQIELFKCIVWQPQIPAFPFLSPLAAIFFSFLLLHFQDHFPCCSSGIY